MNWQDLIQIRIIDTCGIQVTLGWLFIVIVLAFCVVAQLVLRRHHSGLETVEANIKLGGIGDIKIKPNYDDIQIAHKAWVELVTRKAALPFDEESDVIAEVYNSWYELFGRMRDLAKEIPAKRLRSRRDTQRLVMLIVDALNKGLRPHLTKWQAKFRRWYVAQLDLNKDASPQEIQRLYPEYDALVSDLKRVNSQIVEYAEVLKKISLG
jgi:hypothetical protein